MKKYFPLIPLFYYKFGLSKPDVSSVREKSILLTKYKVSRYKVTRQNRKDNQDINNNIIQEANSEGELWKITNDVINLKTKTQLNFKSMVKKLKTKKQ